jgi:cytochrome b561
MGMTMRWKNNRLQYGVVSVFLHWLVAFTVFGLFLLGLWMTGLDYYHSWYQRGPNLHRAVGVLLFLTMAVRLFWRWRTGVPEPLVSHSRLERVAAHLVHVLLYLALFGVMISGYLISTADGRPVNVFGWFQVPALLSGVEGQEDFAGKVHLFSAYSTMALVALHLLGALKHHFLDRDRTLLRMFGR